MFNVTMLTCWGLADLVFTILILIQCVTMLTFANWHETQTTAEDDGHAISFVGILQYFSGIFYK